MSNEEEMADGSTGNSEGHALPSRYESEPGDRSGDDPGSPDGTLAEPGPPSRVAEGRVVARSNRSRMEGRRAGAERFDDEDQTLTGLSVRSEFHTGPLPSPAALAAYNEIQPGFADRIVTMAEKALDAEIEADLVPVRAEAFGFRFATVSISLLPWAALLGGFALILMGENGIGWVSAVVGLIAVTPQIISATRRALSPAAESSAEQS